MAKEFVCKIPMILVSRRLKSTIGFDFVGTNGLVIDIAHWKCGSGVVYYQETLFPFVTMLSGRYQIVFCYSETNTHGHTCIQSREIEELRFRALLFQMFEQWNWGYKMRQHVRRRLDRTRTPWQEQLCSTKTLTGNAILTYSWPKGSPLFCEPQ